MLIDDDCDDDGNVDDDGDIHDTAHEDKGRAVRVDIAMHCNGH